MYYGIVENEGKRVSDTDAFSYACEQVEAGGDELQAEFMEIAASSDSFFEMRQRVIEWFYSGSWIYSF